MKAADRDLLLVRVDEKVSGFADSLDKVWKAIIGLYGLWGAIIITVTAAVIRASR